MGFDAEKAAAAAADPSRLMEFKPPFFDLAKKSGVPVVVCAMRGTDDVWPVGSNMMRGGTITLSVSAPLDGADYADDAAFAAAARKRMGELYAKLCESEA